MSGASDRGGAGMKRRDLFGIAVGLEGGLVLREAVAGDAAVVPSVPADATKVIGQGITPLGLRSPFEEAQIAPVCAVTGTVFAPIERFR